MTTPPPKGRGFLIQHNEPMQTNYRGFTGDPKAINDMPCRLMLFAALMSRSSVAEHSGHVQEQFG